MEIEQEGQDEKILQNTQLNIEVLGEVEEDYLQAFERDMLYASFITQQLEGYLRIYRTLALNESFVWDSEVSTFTCTINGEEKFYDMVFKLSLWGENIVEAIALDHSVRG
jgi:hypothetical protein